MTLPIGYCDNFEDVTVSHILRQVKCGFYIDVGSNSPLLYSVTRLLYEKGWTGINIDPHPAFSEIQKRCRPKDVYLQLALSNRKGKSILHCINEHNNQSLLRAKELDSYSLDINSVRSTLEKNTFKKVGYYRKIIVNTDTLNAICSKYVMDRDNIHFLKIDVEGHERQVILSNDWGKYRPWLIIVEAQFKPLNWGILLLEANYIFTYYDGLNKFYVAAEHEELLENFKQPFKFSRPPSYLHKEYPLM